MKTRRWLRWVFALLVIVPAGAVGATGPAGPNGVAGPSIAAVQLRLEPLCVSPRAAPQSQLVRLVLDPPPDEAPAKARVELPGMPALEVPIEVGVAGPKLLTMGISGIEKETEARVTMEVGAEVASASIRLRPLRPWTLYLVQHSHTDIGYTDLPSRISVDHLEFIDEAVRSCDLTDSYPEAARFRWTCEGTWAVERYLATRPPAMVAAFLERVRQGRIEVTALSMNMTDLASEEVYVRAFLPIARLRERGISIRGAMQCDVNGYPWCLPELLQDVGVTGFAGGINQTRSTLPYEFPRAIEWRSPSSGSVLAWRGEHYMFANTLGFRESLEKVLARLPGYLVSLEKRGFPYRSVLLQMAGYFTDNAAPCHRASDLVREWNERFAFPRVRLATLSEALDAIRCEGDAPVTAKAWPDWWADGVGSAALEASVAREAQETLQFAETFLALSRTAHEGDPDLRGLVAEAYLHALIYGEHTFGASDSVTRPDSINTKTQWGEKAAQAHRARWIATELESAAFSRWAAGSVPRGEAGLVVFNALSWARSGPVRLRLPRGFAEERTPFRIVDPEREEEVPYQFVRSAVNFREVELVARDVPPLGQRSYRLEVGAEPALPAAAFQFEASALSNERLVVELDPKRAAIRAIRSRGSGENLVGAEEYGFNQYIHERIAHEKGRSHLWPMAPSYDAAAFERAAAGDATVAVGVRGPVRASLVMSSKVTVPAGEVKLETEVSLYRGIATVFIENRVIKPGSVDPEASYFAFPFAAPSPPRAELVGGVLTPGLDQIPGSASDWHAIQRWVRFEGNGRSAVWATVDAPLVQFGGLNTGRWGKGLTLEKPLVYSWIMNNYWFTNFVASQTGSFTFRYAVAGGEAAVSDAEASRFGKEACSPLRAVVAEGKGNGPWHRSLLAVEPAEVVLVTAKEAEMGSRRLVVRLRNVSSQSVEASLRVDPSLGLRSARRTNLLEEPQKELLLADGAVGLALGPWALATVVLDR